MSESLNKQNISGQSMQVTVSSNHLKAIKRRFILSLSTISFLGFVFALFQLFTVKIGLLEVTLFSVMYVITTLGATVGFHRYFSHQAFKTSLTIRIILGILGSMAAQGSVISWVSIHRCHHQYTDRIGDPHSPHLHGKGIKAKLKGLWHAYLGWLLIDGELPNSLVFAKDLLKDPLIFQINRLYTTWIVLGLLIPTVLGGVITLSWIGAFQGFIWGGIVRLFWTFNSGYILNAIAHTYGHRLFNTPEQSRNNFWMAILTLGDGWHNNHHAFPNSANCGLKWWQIDISFWAIKLLEILGLVWDVKLPKNSLIKSKETA